ncbi:CRISPR system precrRNA processing endoribonuclease RAMP protein Cas6 [Skermanella sp. TT6]|uniref:CRISPR system precrRNA processing endoribonuclease RAMP protein Cas6 n=1 Tax=Skermanella cutis TaxID=2775420 RepID=A0ABX7BCQ8_9PROT|nr:CRISPR system precrRNA processing endoribonuclease RAMP protein Cas6 [Skermanella sp. TT6]QQP92184.1 CRISPR system precrRNA processing endoribonuclease RAMP protein Cas6 [Skermanella sp. TT6]
MTFFDGSGALDGDGGLDRLTPLLFETMGGVTVRPWRLSLTTLGVRASVPMLRGVWGAALRDADPGLYEQVFVGAAEHRGPEAVRLPRYVLRAAPPDPDDAPALDFITIGLEAAQDAALLAAWAVALRRGLGPDRVPCDLKAATLLSPNGRLRAGAEEGAEANSEPGWSLDQARWPLAGDPPVTPCRLVFDAPLRILRQGRLVTAPTLTDIVLSASRRLAAFLPPSLAGRASGLAEAARAVASVTPQRPWQGARTDLVRWSSSQQAEVEMRGVSGSLALPRGPGSLWPLLLAGTWLHLGKGTVFGLGQPAVEPLD